MCGGRHLQRPHHPLHPPMRLLSMQSKTTLPQKTMEIKTNFL